MRFQIQSESERSELDTGSGLIELKRSVGSWQKCSVQDDT